MISSMDSTPINIRWIIKIMYNISLQIILHEYQNKKHNINTAVLIARAFGPSRLTKLVFILLLFILISAENLYNTMRRITIPVF